MYIKFRCLIILLLMLTINSATAETKVAGVLGADAEWSSDKSPYIVIDDLTIPEGLALTIEPGTEIRFRKGVSMVVKGDLFAAGENGNEIVFSADNPDEPWGGVRIFDTRSAYGDFIESEAASQKVKGEAVRFSGKPKNYDKRMEYTEGTYIANCVFENVGMHKRPTTEPQSRVSGALVCYNTAPYIENCTFKNNYFIKGGAVSTLYYAAPLIKDCKFYNNRSDQGGAAIYCFFFASPIITGNVIRDNFSKESGGAILINSSKPSIKNNVIFRNNSAENGGAIAIYASQSTINNNQIRDNIAGKSGNGIYLAAILSRI